MKQQRSCYLCLQVFSPPIRLDEQNRPLSVPPDEDRICVSCRLSLKFGEETAKAAP